MSAAEYDLEQPYETENTEFGYTLMKFPDASIAERVTDEFGEKYAKNSIDIDWLPGINLGIRAEMSKGGRSFSGIVYLGEDKILSTEGSAENLEEVADEVLK